jgi:hypothetical protein
VLYADKVNVINKDWISFTSASKVTYIPATRGLLTSQARATRPMRVPCLRFTKLRAILTTSVQLLSLNSNENNQTTRIIQFSKHIDGYNEMGW